MPDRNKFRKDWYDIEIIVSATCNLRCVNCDHFAPVADEYFETPEHTREILLRLKKANIPVRKIILIGGEPLLNPALPEICAAVREILPDNEVAVFTNGIALSEMTPEERKIYSGMGVMFSITPYPIDIDYEKLQQDLRDENIDVGMLTSRFTFENYIPDPEPNCDDPGEKFNECGRFVLPVLTIHGDRLYYCPFGYGSKYIGIPETENDYILLSELTQEKLEMFCRTPKDKCRYCRDKTDSMLWIRSTCRKDEFRHDLKWLYLNDYARYDEIVNNKAGADKYLQDNALLQTIDYNHNLPHTTNIFRRFRDSKIDIIIPFYHVNEEVLNDLERELMQQTFISRCTIYLISDCSPDEEMVFDRFYQHSTLSCVLLKTAQRCGPGGARNVGLEHCYGDYVYFLDADDGFYEPTTLDAMYTFALMNPDVKVFTGDIIRNGQVKESGKSTRWLISNQFLKENDLKFIPIFLGEDFLFFHQMEKYLQAGDKLDMSRVIYNYRTNFKEHVGEEFCNNVHLSLILSRLLKLSFDDSDRAVQQIFNTILIGDGYFEDLQGGASGDMVIMTFLLCFAICAEMDKKFGIRYDSLRFRKNPFTGLILNQVQNKQYFVRIDQHTTVSLEQIEKFIREELEERGKEDLALSKVLEVLDQLVK